MAIRESLLNTITTVGSSDFVRIVTAAGASSKATVANLFKSFESGLGAKSDLSTSDYVRVVGSDNELYKQSLNDVAGFVKGLHMKMVKFENLEVNNGYVTVPYPSGYSYLDYCIIQPEYTNAAILGWTAVLQRQSGPHANLYVRQGTSTPTNGSKVTFVAIFIKA